MRMRTELLVGLVSGTIIGSAFGLALAPKRGKETRESLEHQLVKIKDLVVKNGEARGEDTIAAGEARADYLH
jgi:gas vesicle protein